MASTSAWIKAMRLRTLPLSFASIFVGSALALLFFRTYRYGVSFSWTTFGLTLLTTLCLQVLSNFANDYGDFVKGTDNKDRVGPERALQSGEISKKQMLTAIIIVSVLCLLSGLALIFTALKEFDHTLLIFFLIGLAAIAAAIKYTVGKNAYGYSGLGDLFVLVFFGFVGVLGTFYLQTQQYDRSLLMPAMVMGCFSMAVLNLNNMRDIQNDKASGKKTLAVKLGFEKAKTYHYFLFLVAYACIAVYLAPIGKLGFSVGIWMSPVLLIHVVHLSKVRRTKEPKELDSQLKVVALSALLFSLIVFGLVLY